jgi:hypothetical protein
MSIHQGEIVRVDFEVPPYYNQNLHSNKLLSTGVSLEMNLLIGEPTLWREYQGFVLTILGCLGLGAGILCYYRHVKEGNLKVLTSFSTRKESKLIRATI